MSVIVMHINVIYILKLKVAKVKIQYIRMSARARVKRARDFSLPSTTLSLDSPEEKSRRYVS